MRTTYFICLAAALALTPSAYAQAPTTPSAAIGKPLPRIEAELIDVSGKAEKKTRFDSSKTKHVTVYVAVGTHCPSTQAYSERLAELSTMYAKKKVDFLFVYPDRNDDHAAQVAFHRQKSFGGKLIDDKGGRIAHLLGAQRTTEVFVVDKQGMLVFHGSVDDSRDDPRTVKQHYAAEAIDAALAGKPVSIASTQVFACGIHY